MRHFHNRRHVIEIRSIDGITIYSFVEGLSDLVFTQRILREFKSLSEILGIFDVNTFHLHIRAHGINFTGNNLHAGSDGLLFLIKANIGDMNLSSEESRHPG